MPPLTYPISAEVGSWQLGLAVVNNFLSSIGGDADRVSVIHTDKNNFYIERSFNMNKALYWVMKYAKHEIIMETSYDKALEITCNIEKLYFKHRGSLMPNKLFDEVFDLIYAA